MIFVIGRPPYVTEFKVVGPERSAKAIKTSARLTAGNCGTGCHRPLLKPPPRISTFAADAVVVVVVIDVVLPPPGGMLVVVAMAVVVVPLVVVDPVVVIAEMPIRQDIIITKKQISFFIINYLIVFCLFEFFIVLYRL